MSDVLTYDEDIALLRKAEKLHPRRARQTIISFPKRARAAFGPWRTMDTCLDYANSLMKASRRTGLLQKGCIFRRRPIGLCLKFERSRLFFQPRRFAQDMSLPPVDRAAL
jgi:hypothetical protein